MLKEERGNCFSLNLLVKTMNWSTRLFVFALLWHILYGQRPESSGGEVHWTCPACVVLACPWIVVPAVCEYGLVACAACFPVCAFS